MGSCLYSVRINGDIFVEYNSKRNRTEHQYRQNNPMNVSNIQRAVIDLRRCVNHSNVAHLYVT